MTTWATAFGPACKALAAAIEPERPALVHGAQTLSWGEFDARTDAIAAGLLESGLRPGDAVGQVQRNAPEYVLAFFAAAKAGLIPVNINYHYRAGEMADILSRFGVAAVIRDAAFASVVDGARASAPALRLVFDSGALPQARPGPGFEPAGGPDTLFYVATGGTTGTPKAVMWQQEEAWRAFQVASWPALPGTAATVAATLDDHLARATASPPPSLANRSPLLLLSPLMHGAGLFAALIVLLRGGTLVTLPGTRFDPDLAIDTIAAGGIVQVGFVGDAFASPLVEAIARRPDAADKLATLRFVTSSGAVFSPALKSALLAANPALTIIDALGSSESAGTAVTVTTSRGTAGAGGGFGAIAGRDLAVLDDKLRPLAAGSAEYGILARSGPLPLGYLGEDALNARTFPTIDGKRWLVTGDRARFSIDGRIEFIGRDNLCINTGGEKVFPEEVEAALQTHAAVADARVIGLSDPRFGQRIAAVVRTAAGSDALSAALDAHVRASLAAYKVPRAWFFTGRPLRLNNGKPDYATARAIAGEG